LRKPLKFALFAGLFSFTAVFAINFCATLFQCGCQFLWAAGADNCNINHATGPHCPWCTNGGAGFLVSVVPVFFVQGFLAFRNNAWDWKKRLLAGLAAFPVVAGILGGIVGWFQGYWN
jgi:hypothetical protein